jgi:triosephosphate isomerase
MRKQIAAANWKMNLTLQQAEKLIDDLVALPHTITENQQVVFGVPFPYLQNIKKKIAGKRNVTIKKAALTLAKQALKCCKALKQIM